MTQNNNLRTALDIAETYADEMQLALRIATGSTSESREQFYFRQALEACAALDRLLVDLGTNLPDEFEPYRKMVDQRKQIWGESYEAVKREVAKDLRYAVAKTSEWHIGKADLTRRVRIYEETYTDEGEAYTQLRVDAELPLSETLFKDVPKRAATLECILESQQLRLDVDRTLKTNRIDPDSDKGRTIHEKLRLAAASDENAYLLQQFYEKHNGGNQA